MKTTKDFRKMKSANEKISMLTSYDAPSAKLAEAAGIDVLLVGDSLGMVVLGYDSTIPVTVDDMVHHTKAVKRGAPNTFVVSDLPYLSYHASLKDAFSNAKLLMQDAGAHAVKMEGGGDVLLTAEKLIEAGVPVVTHLGLTPQSVGVLGGYSVQGKSEESANKLISEAKIAEQIGSSMLVLECVPEWLGKQISEELTIPVIGIGAGRYTDGQVLVYHDVIGYTQGHVPKFVKQYTNISEKIEESLILFAQDVKKGSFPEKNHTFLPYEDHMQTLYGGKQK
ncbi:3-methyl-2-oxobutanoate hydroxymethyltransferase [Bacillus shivajii]|uniref:3-methyl-2-oxobutanoate hydroxymethyltransferase n=1 Tax=Bacillus shivajii TaxID=1983719 RepID=UPI001CF98E4A|nr:3-methyl-2-oxobutanoate hydroxymethyltransferase [Bacillus shivajii]UCZ54806.1 3-methyl-2-oxobutanoate hydroxymethyltransferase [Bacillus shivajii]